MKNGESKNITSKKRRSFLVTAGTLFAASFILPKNSFASELNQSQVDKKTLIIYFSHSGNTEYFANEINLRVKGDMHKIITVQGYPDDYDTTVDIAKKEQNDNFRPKLTSKAPNLSEYENIFIGYPNWWGTLPMALFTFFEENDFSGKNLIPFTTHEGSYFGRSLGDLEKLNPNATILEGLEIRGRSVKSSSAKNNIDSWLKKLNFIS